MWRHLWMHPKVNLKIYMGETEKKKKDCLPHGFEWDTKEREKQRFPKRHLHIQTKKETEEMAPSLKYLITY